jgi:flagellar biogenesis protein FliO
MNKNDKGQTLIEFMLVAMVLIAACWGVFKLYKRYWNEKFSQHIQISENLSVHNDGYVK